MFDKNYINQNSSNDNKIDNFFESDFSDQKNDSHSIQSNVDYRIDSGEAKEYQKSETINKKTSSEKIVPKYNKSKIGRDHRLTLKLDENELIQVKNIVNNVERQKKQDILYKEKPVPFRAPYPPLALVILSVIFSSLVILSISSSIFFQKISIYYSLHDWWIFILAGLTCILLLFSFKGIHYYLTTTVVIIFCLTFSGVILVSLIRFEVISKQYALYAGSIIFTAFSASLPLPVRAFGATRYLFIGGPKFYKRFFYPIAVFLSIGIFVFCFFIYECKKMEIKSLDLLFSNKINIQNFFKELECSESLESIEKEVKYIQFWLEEFYETSMMKLQKQYIECIINTLDNSPDLCNISDTQLSTFDHQKSNPELWQKIVSKGKRIHTFVRIHRPILHNLTKKNRKTIQDQIDKWLESPFSSAKAFFLSELLLSSYIDNSVRSNSYLLNTLVQDKIRITDKNKQVHYVSIFDPKFLRGDAIVNNFNSKLKGNSFKQTTNWESLILFSNYPHSNAPPPHSILIVRRVIDVSTKKQSKNSNNQVWLIFSTSELEKSFIDTMKYNPKIVSSKSFPDREENICGNGLGKDSYELNDGSEILIKRCHTRKKKYRVIVITLKI
ncbi:membrane protein [Candidatus Magnetomorum sp. HK-1]|nr:membrane protein [Candidatus Magnetomorum sp. HK-1]